MAVRWMTVLVAVAMLIACGKGGKEPAAQAPPAGGPTTEAARDPASGAATQPAGAPAPSPTAAPEGSAPPPAGASAVLALANPSPEIVVDILEFSDFQCPFCGRVNPTLKKIKETYGDKVRVVFMHQPLGFHQHARPAAIASEAARRQGRFQEMHDELFANQQSLTPADFERHAIKIGLDMERFKKDVADPAVAAIVDQHQAIATAAGVAGTPTFFVNGKILRGAQEFPEFKKLIDEELALAGDKKGEAWTRQRLLENSPNLHGFLYEGKKPPPVPPQRPPVDRTVYKVSVDPELDAIKGEVNAPVTLVVFSEFQCPFCKRLEPVLKQLMSDYQGKLRIVFKHNPLPFHKDAMPASMATLCAKDQGRFWEMHDKLWDNQQSLDGPSLERYATELGLDGAQFKACMAEERHKKQILADQELAQKVTARGTPNSFVNGRKMTGAKPLEEYKDLIEEELKKAEALAAKGIPAERLYDEVIKAGKVFEPLEEKVNEFVLDGSPMHGKKTARVQIVVFSDFQCPFCARVTKPLEELKAKYGDELVVVFKHFPLSFHKEAMPAAVAAMCAHEQGKFWAYHDVLFANMKALLPANLKTYAQMTELDISKFEKCLAEPKVQSVIERDMKEAREAGVRGTPTIFVNGRKFSSPSGYNVDAFSSVIDKHILKK